MTDESREECLRCAGYGLVEVWVDFPSDPGMFLVETCPECNGNGYTTCAVLDTPKMES